MAAKYISVAEAMQMAADLHEEVRKHTEKCLCHAGKKCARCMMKEGLV